MNIPQPAVYDYFLCLSQLNPIAANRGATKDIQPPALSAILVKFCSGEEIYNSLEFLKRKRFRRDNFLSSLYSTLQEEIKREIYMEHTSIVRSLDITMNHKKPFPLCIYESLLEIVTIRMLLLKGYSRISIQLNFVPFEAWLSIVDEAWNRYQNFNFSEAMEPLTNSVKLEILILRHMILAHKSLCDFDMMGSTLNLFSAHSHYMQWRTLCYTNPEQETISEPSNVLSLFATLAEQFNFKPNKTPLQVSSLMKWIEKFYDHIASKMTLYFHRSLLERERVTGGDERTLWRKCVLDFHAMIRNFRKRSGAHSVSIIYEVDTSRPFSNMGFVCSKTPYQPPTGLESFPFIFSYPEDHPVEHWPNIVSMIMTDNQTYTNQSQEVSSPSSVTPTSLNEYGPMSSTSTMSLSGSHALSTALSVAGFTALKPTPSQTQPMLSPTYQALFSQGTNTTSEAMPSNVPPTPSTSNVDIKLPAPTQFYDKKVGATYYLSRIDTRVTLAIVFLDRHTSRDTVGSEFINELTSRLRLTHATQLLARAD